MVLNKYSLWLLLATLNVAAQHAQVGEFTAYKINAPMQIEPSGLTLFEGALYTVCDDNNAIFKLDLAAAQDQTVTAETFMQLDAMQVGALALDLEGITRMDGDWVLVSEAHHKLLRVSAGQLSWLPQNGSVFPAASGMGLFATPNAGIESLVYLGERRFLMSVERQPRGLIEIEIDANGDFISTQKNQFLDNGDYLPKANRHPDLTGLFLHDGVIYGLHRNAYRIVELVPDASGAYVEGRTWDYEHIIQLPEYRYADMSYGHAEGLAVDDDYFYVVLDNNNIPSQSDPQDFRSLLLRIKRD